MRKSSSPLFGGGGGGLGQSLINLRLYLLTVPSCLLLFFFFPHQWDTLSIYLTATLGWVADPNLWLLGQRIFDPTAAKPWTILFIYSS